MDCPACGSDVPPGRSACPRCGTPLPPTGERPGPGPYSAAGAPIDSPAAAPNPGTQPLPAVDAGDEHPWNVPPGPHKVTGEEGSPPDHGNATQILGPPVGNAAAPEPPAGDWIPGPPAEWSSGPPAGSPMPPPGPPPAGWNPGPPGTAPAPAGSPAGQPFGGPGPGVPPPGHPPYGWDQSGPPELGGQPGRSPEADGRGKNRKILLAGGIAAAVVVAGGLAYALTQGSSGGGGTPAAQRTTAGTAAQQASAVEQILKSGQTARGHLPTRLRTCDDVSAGVAGFQQVVRDRQQELSRTKALEVDRLPNGARLRQAMITAYQNSLEADQAYLAWAKKIRARRCGGRIAPLVAPYQDALSANDKAGPAKRRVAALWKPIAAANGLPAYAWNRL